MISIKVISLRHSFERRKLITQQFLRKRIDYSFFDAVETKNSSLELDLYFSNNLFEEKERRKASSGEVGNKISQYLVIEDFVVNSNNDILIVFEDDVNILCNATAIETLMKEFKESKYDIMVLGYSKCDDLYEKHTNIINPLLITNRCESGIAFGPRYFHSTSGSVGFAIKRNAAKKFLDIKPQFTLTDDWKFFNSIGFNLAYTKPMVVREELSLLESTVGHANISSQGYHSDSLIFSVLLVLRKYLIGYFNLIRLLLVNLLQKIY